MSPEGTESGERPNLNEDEICETMQWNACGALVSSVPENV
jgi:hypothetical protein